MLAFVSSALVDAQSAADSDKGSGSANAKGNCGYSASIRILPGLSLRHVFYIPYLMHRRVHWCLFTNDYRKRCLVDEESSLTPHQVMSTEAYAPSILFHSVSTQPIPGPLDRAASKNQIALCKHSK